MDCEFNTTSDILFPSDSGLPKLSSPLDYKVPEAVDWATQDFMYTFKNKSANEMNNFLSFQQYVPVQEEVVNEEKQILSQVSRYLAMENSELQEILKSFHLSVQGSIKNNLPADLPGLSWAEEANQYYGGNDIGSLEMVQELEGKRSIADDAETASTLSVQYQEKPVLKKKKSFFYKIKSNTRKVFQKLLVST